MVLNWIISWKIYVTLIKVDRANPFPNPLWVSMINSVIKMVAMLGKRSKNNFFAVLVFFHIDTTYIKLEWNSKNFLIFWCTLLATD